MRTCSLAVALLVLALLAAPGGAPAQEPGVFVDPDSPTGEEYDIPLERARRQASSDPATAAQPSRSESAELFGEGIEPPRAEESAGSAPAGGGDGGASDRGADRPRESGAEPRRELPPGVEAAIRNPGAPGGGSPGGLLFGGLAAVLLTAGVAAGLTLRRRGS